MKLVEKNIKFSSDEDYFLFEEKAELRHELINGNLYEMSGVSKFHNDICGNIFFLLRVFFKGKDFRVAFENFKIKTPDGSYFYPDVAICESNSEKYYAEKPVLIIEVLSENTRKFDLTDKFIQYQKIPSLNYYLCVEPEQQVIIFYFKNEAGEWMTETYTKDEDAITLKTLDFSFTLKEIYKPQ